MPDTLHSDKIFERLNTAADDHDLRPIVRDLTLLVTTVDAEYLAAQEARSKAADEYVRAVDTLQPSLGEAVRVDTAQARLDAAIKAQKLVHQLVLGED